MAHSDSRTHHSSDTHDHGHGHDEHAEHSDHGGHAGHGGHHAHHAVMFKRLFWIMLGLAIPTVLLSPSFGHLLGYTPPAPEITVWIAAALGTVMYVWGGQPFLTGGWSEIKGRSPGMMLLIAMAITVAFLASWGATLGLLPHQLEFWWELALLVVIMLLGHWMEMRSLAQTSSALDSLAELLPEEAERVTDVGTTETVKPSDLQLGDVVLVRPGGRIPADGTVTEGSAHVDESMITGESKPVRRTVDDRVVAGTVSQDAALRVTVDAVGEKTALAGIQAMVATAQSSTTKTQRLADKVSGWLFWYATISAVITFGVWLAIGMPESAVVSAITVLVIACPHALGLAIPLVVSIATERAAKTGVLVKDRLALENVRTVNAVLFDKTGTLTHGRPELSNIAAAQGHDENEVLRLAASAEQDSEHPLAKAIVAAARDANVAMERAHDFETEAATGVEATVGGRRVAVGGPALLRGHGLEPMDHTSEWGDQGATVLHVLIDGAVVGALGLRDTVRPESREAVDALHKAGVRVVMITGDAQAVATSVARELNIDEVFAEVKPQDKAARVAELQGRGLTVAMVGDGVNDAPALAQADVGIAIGAGTDVAAASADLILAGDDPRAVLGIMSLSAAAYRKMTQNLWWAAGYNLLAVPLAAGVLAPVGFVMPMAVGAILMSLSTVIVAVNAQTLRRHKVDLADSDTRSQPRT